MTQWQYPPFVAPALLAGLLSAGVGVYGIRLIRRRGRNATLVAFVLMGFSTALWTLSQTAMMVGTDLAWKSTWYFWVNLGTFVLPGAWLVFAAAYSGYEDWITRWTVAPLVADFVVATALLVTSRSHDLLFGEPALATVGGYTYLEPSYGPAFNARLVYVYLVVFGGIFLVLSMVARSRDLYRSQSAAVVLGVTVPAVVNLLFFAGGIDLPFNPTSLTFSVTGLAFAYAISRYRLMDVVPVARDTAIERMRDGYLAVDPEGRVVDSNPAARSLLAVEEGVIGRPVTDLLPEDALPVAVEAGDRDGGSDAGPGADPGGHSLANGGGIGPSEDGAGIDPSGDREGSLAPERTEFLVDGPDGERYVDAEVSRVVEDGGFVAHLVSLRDVTGRERRERELRRQNERLEEFAGVVSHDLRNPLGVAKGYLGPAREAPEEYIPEVERSLDRMEDIIEDVLALARQGEAVGETEPVDLEGAAWDAWEYVDTPEATLVVADTRTVAADRDRLLQLLENLYRNAVEHAGPAVAVRVGTTGDGFYVEDDGPGIDPDRRDRVFESGHTTARDGTGFGLAIVKRIAEAHGWTVAATEGTEGGARFEVTVEGTVQR